MSLRAYCAHRARRASTPLLIGGKGHCDLDSTRLRPLPIREPHLLGPRCADRISRRGRASPVSSYTAWPQTAGSPTAPATCSWFRTRHLRRARFGTGAARNSARTPFIISTDLHRRLVEQLPVPDIRQADQILDRITWSQSNIEISQNHKCGGLAKKAMNCRGVRPGTSRGGASAEATKVAVAGGARDVLVLMGKSPL